MMIMKNYYKKSLKNIPKIFNKWANLVGIFFMLIICISLGQYILKSHSIHLLQPFYIKWIILSCISIMSFFTLDYLIKYLVFIYFIKN